MWCFELGTMLGLGVRVGGIGFNPLNPKPYNHWCSFEDEAMELYLKGVGCASARVLFHVAVFVLKAQGLSCLRCGAYVTLCYGISWKEIVYLSACG